MTPVKFLVAFKTPQTDNPQACHAGLGVTAGNLAEVLSEHGVDASAIPVRDGFYIRDGLRAKKWPGVTHFVMCAPFFDTAFLEALCKEFSHIHFAVVFHSNVGFLGVDNWSMGVLGEQLALSTRLPNFSVAGNCKKFCDAVLAAFGVRCVLLPNLYFLHGPVARIRAPWSGGTLKIGAFGATRVLKNLPTAAWASVIMARKLNAPVEFYVSNGRQEGSGSASVVTSIKSLFAHHKDCITFIESPWAGWLNFRQQTVRKMHLLLQPSFTESFNGVTADGIAEGVASVVGPAIPWVPSNWIANPDDALEIAETGISLLRDKHAPKKGYEALAKHNQRAICAWQSFLRGK